MKLRDLSDELCKESGLSVIENPETSKGKSHFEWDMSRQDLSWKDKLKFAIDQVVKDSVNFNDFLLKCKGYGIEVEYTPDKKINLKFRMSGQQRFTRAKTLGWYYEPEQILGRIQMYKGVLNYKPEIKPTLIEKEDTTIHKWSDLNGMKNADKIKAILNKRGIDNSDNLMNVINWFYGKRMSLVGSLNDIQNQIELLSEQIKSANTFKKYKSLSDETEKPLRT